MIDIQYYFDVAKLGLSFGVLVSVVCFLSGFVISWLVGIFKHF